MVLAKCKYVAMLNLKIYFCIHIILLVLSVTCFKVLINPLYNFILNMML